MKINNFIANTVKSIFTIGILIAFFFFNVNIKSDQGRKIIVKIINDNQSNTHKQPITKDDILNLINSEQSIFTVGKVVNTNLIEKFLEKNVLIKKAISYKNYKNEVIVNIVIKNPIARLIDKYNNHIYIDKDGVTMPIVPNASYRIIIVHDKEDYYIKKKQNKENYSVALLNLLKYITKDKFLNANIHNIEIDEKGNIEIGVLIGDHKIEFGQPDDIKKKIDKLTLFYTKILPHIGWDKYKKVNLKFNNQIVCE